MDPEIQEELDYLEEVLEEYEKYVNNIGSNGYTAPLMLYYRDEIEESLRELTPEADLDLKPYWKRAAELDNIVRARAALAVKEIGYNNFKQYQIINDPPKLHWWWYLDKIVAPPLKESPRWQFWKR